MALYVPPAEVHAAYLRDGITRYSYDDVLSAVAAAEQAEAAWDEAVNAAYMMLKPYEAGMGLYYGHPASYQALVDVLPVISNRVPGCLSLSLSRGSSEALPLGKLNKDAATYRKATRDLRKCMEAIA